MASRLKATIREAISADLQGVALIGEHGDYPTNEKGRSSIRAMN